MRDYLRVRSGERSGERRVGSLRHVGIMANYACNAACRHCLYACSPDRGGGYITQAAAEKTCELLIEGGCYSVHIGGGEPFLDFDGLLALVETLGRAGISIDYIETNAYWAEDPGAAQRLGALRRAGADALCISVDPFHAEYVPVKLPLKLAEICRSAGFGYFLWQERYVRALSKRDAAYSRGELERALSRDYIFATAKSYGIRLGGRAVNIEEEFTKNKPLESLLDAQPCRGLLSGGCHTDVNVMYIPSGCTGIAFPLEEAVRGVPIGKYPAFDALFEGGVAGLLRHAQALSFAARPQGYPSGCALCFHIRQWLCADASRRAARHPELDPEHYAESLRHYSLHD
ncbi:MAG: radical SAM protein [Oscillospiraceae bacterium]|nr:radical SAM protein [Oscillospiraceae bacterium]